MTYYSFLWNLLQALPHPQKNNNKYFVIFFQTLLACHYTKRLYRFSKWHLYFTSKVLYTFTKNIFFIKYASFKTKLYFSKSIHWQHRRSKQKPHISKDFPSPSHETALSSKGKRKRRCEDEKWDCKRVMGWRGWEAFFVILNHHMIR